MFVIIINPYRCTRLRVKSWTHLNRTNGLQRYQQKCFPILSDGEVDRLGKYLSIFPHFSMTSRSVKNYTGRKIIRNDVNVLKEVLDAYNPGVSI